MYDIPAIVEDEALRVSLQRSVQGESPGFLRSAKLKITARCNLKCVMCRYGKGWAPPEMPTQRWLGILDELAQLGCRKVHFSGGEVLVRKDFEQLVAHAAAARLKVTFTSNLTLLDKVRAKALMRAKISSISTSLDGASRKTHEAVRGIAGSFRKTLRSIDLLARERERRGRATRLRINFVMMRDNYADYPKLVLLAGELGATDVVAMPVDSKNPRLRLSKKMIGHYNEEIAPQVAAARAAVKMSLSDDRIYPYGKHSAEILDSVEGRYAGGFYREHACYAPFLHIFVAWDGKVYLCCMTNGRIESLGDLQQLSVRDVFLGEAFAAMRRQMMHERLDACHACDMYTRENRVLAEVLADVPLPAMAASVLTRVRLPVLG